MCGIVGYLGPQDPKEIILEGLKKLEYRGYDSAGVAIFDGPIVRRVRAEGKLKNLEQILFRERFRGHLGIGHTRWATHGAPSLRNAHPHQAGGISLVHNGIIENYLEIREELESLGVTPTSETDSELVAHLIDQAIQKEGDLFLAVKNILGRLRGAFSVLVIWDQKPDHLVAFKDGPPLMVGLGENQVFIVSDIQAAIRHTNKFIYLEDRQIVSVKMKGESGEGQLSLDLYSSEGVFLPKIVREVPWNKEQDDGKHGYSHFMLKEIYEQPMAVSSAMSPHISSDRKSICLSRVGFGALASGIMSREEGDGTKSSLFANEKITVYDLDDLDPEDDWINTQSVFAEINRVVIVACGTSYYAGLIGKYYIETLACLPVEVDVASEFRYRHPVIEERTLVIVISQSGETADTLAALRYAKNKLAVTLSICNVPYSSIDREARGHLYMNSGAEIGVASTKAFTSTLTVLNCLAVAMGRSRQKMSTQTEEEHVKALLKVPSQVEVALAYDKYFLDASEELKKFKGFLYLGRGVSFPIALEGALKLKELAYYHAEGYPAGEMKHGPLALIDKQMAIVVVAPSDEWLEKTISNLEEARARGGKIMTVGCGDNPQLRSLSSRHLPIPAAHWSTNPIISVVPLQLMAFHLANSLGCDVDQPRHLAKSVTVE